MAVEFEEESNADGFLDRAILGQSETPKMVSFLINIGISKNKKNAERVLLGSSILFMFLAVSILIFFVLENKNPNHPTIPTEELGKL